jgi:long-chain acyl-CoA synthetase
MLQFQGEMVKMTSSHKISSARGLAPLPYEFLTMPQFLSRTVEKAPEKSALVFMGNHMNYKTFNETVNRLANALLDMKVGAGDRVALLLPNIPQMAVAVYAVWRIGAVAVMNNPLYTDRELEHQLNDSGATVLICLDLLAPRMIALKNRTDVRRIVVAHIRDYLGFFTRCLFPLVARDKHKTIPPAENLYEWTDLLKAYPSTHSGNGSKMEGIASLQYTGGTTGVSKGVVLTHENLSKNAQQAHALFEGQNLGDVVLGSLPIFHAFGAFVMNLSVMSGYTLVLIPRPEPLTLMKAIAENEVSIFPAVPTMFVGILNHPKRSRYNLGSLKICVSGAAPCPVDVIQQFETQTGAQIVEGFGISEASPVTHINPIGGVNKPGSIGLPMPDTQVKIVSGENGNEAVPLGQPGELCIKGPQVSIEGYYNMPEETAETFRDGWLYTGDMAQMDEDGYTYIVDRKKDMILAGGYNIYPREIDEVLFEHPKIQEACAKGLADDYRGETVRAYVVPVTGIKLTEEEVISWCRERLAAYKVPKSVVFMDDLPKSAVGKILRKDLPS